MITRVIYASGTIQKFWDRGIAEDIANQQRAYGYSVTEDRDGDFFVDDQADIEAARISLE